MVYARDRELASRDRVGILRDREYACLGHGECFRDRATWGRACADSSRDREYALLRHCGIGVGSCENSQGS